MNSTTNEIKRKYNVGSIINNNNNSKKHLLESKIKFYKFRFIEDNFYYTKRNYNLDLSFGNNFLYDNKKFKEKLKKSLSSFQYKISADFFTNKFFRYFVIFIFLTLIFSYLLITFYIKNSLIFEAVLSYEYKKVNFRQELSLNQEIQNSIVDLKVEEGITISNYVTGQKIVGEKAKGEISVFNATSDIVVIKASTNVLCISSFCNGLIFVNLQDLNLGPGNSGVLFVEASDIGENYNVPINAGRFQIGTFNPNTEIVASNIRQISGGTPKKNIMVVSKTDIEKAESEALEKIKPIIKSSLILNPNNVNNYFFFEDTLQINKLYVNSDKEGEEKDILNFTLRAEGRIKAVEKGKIVNKIDDIIKQNIPEGYYLDQTSLDYKINPIKFTSNSYLFSLDVTFIARINVDIKDLKSKLVSKKIEEAIKILSNIPNLKLEKYTYSLEFIPDPLKFLPDNPNQIKIKIISLDPKN